MSAQTVSIGMLLGFTLAACAQTETTTRIAATRVGATVPARVVDRDYQPHAGMLRYPDVSASHIAFVYANDIWLVSKEGGQAVPLASPPGQEMFPRFSPDGRTIAFVGNYDGNEDLYTVSTIGGIPHRVTHHPSTETLCDWTPEGGLLFFTNGLAGLSRQTELLEVDCEGGLPEKLPVPYGANGAIGDDGNWLAYTPHTRDHRTWKRYRGGMATDIWLFHLKEHTSKKITDWEGTDSQPMWHGKTVYYLSDAGKAHRLNIWAYDTGSGKRRQITKHTTYDVKWPAVGPGAHGQGEIVYQHGSELRLLDLSAGESRVVDVRIPGDRPKIRSKTVDAGEFVQGGNISSTGKRAVIEARGDIWTLPAKHGSARNLTRTNGAAERMPSWSPDGKSIAYFSDATGEYELYTMPSEGKGKVKQLTDNGTKYRFNPSWSPDSKHVTFTDKGGVRYLHTIESGKTKLIDMDPYADSSRASWSSDSRWLAYSKNSPNRLGSVWLYDVSKDTKHQVTSDMFNDTWPTFDREGKYLFLASNREFGHPTYEDLGTTFVYAQTDVLLAIPLRDEVGSPWAPKSDEETWEENKDKQKKSEKDSEASDNDDVSDDDDQDNSEDEDDEDKRNDNGSDKGKNKDDKSDEAGDGEKKEDKKIEPVEIELDGFERRALLIPVDRGNFSELQINHEGKLLYVRNPTRGTETKPEIKIFDLFDEEKKEKTVLENAQIVGISADGKKLLVRRDKQSAIVDAAPDQKFDKPLNSNGLYATINPREEWKQIFTEAWRIKRDYFYDPTMHGVDWDKAYEQYLPMLEDCTSREDLSYVIGEMISELNVGHAYVRGGGDVEDTPSMSVGMLGVDFEPADGAYRIAKVYEGGPWDVDARGPLSQPGGKVKEGDYLLAVNDVPVDTSKDPWAAFQGMAGQTVRLTVSEKATLDDDTRKVFVELLGDEANLRYREWIERNRKYVEEKTDGRVGYLHVPDTGVNGQNNLFRQFYGQTDKEALIIDERWNSGGQIPTRFIELLNRKPVNYWAVRDGRDWSWPPDAHFGPKCMLINGLAGSGGDCFPYYFKETKVGKLIGTRTWGGLVGISGNPTLIDGGQTYAPTFAFYELDGTWGVEGHGVDPDIEVIDDPAEMVGGKDPQLDAAISYMLAELKRNPYRAPKRPAYPDRSGMGIVEKDK